MALAGLLGALDREAEDEIAAIAAAARADVERTLAEAGARRAAARTAALDRLRADARDATAATLAAAARRARTEVLIARAAALDRVRVATAAQLPAAAAAPSSAPLIARLTAAAVAAVGDDGIVRCPPALAATARAAIAGRPFLRLELDELAGAGVHAASTDGRVTVDATLDDLLGRLWPRLRMEVAP